MFIVFQSMLLVSTFNYLDDISSWMTQSHLKLGIRMTKPEHHPHHLPLLVIRDLSIIHSSKTKTVVLTTLRHLLLLCPPPPNNHKVYLTLLSCCPHPSTCPATWTQAQTLLPWITGLLTLWCHFCSPCHINTSKFKSDHETLWLKILKKSPHSFHN